MTRTIESDVMPREQFIATAHTAGDRLIRVTHVVDPPATRSSRGATGFGSWHAVRMGVSRIYGEAGILPHKKGSKLDERDDSRHVPNQTGPPTRLA